MHFFILLCGLMAVVGAEAAEAGEWEQTDWSGGEGAATTTTDWTNTFSGSENVSWWTEPGQLELATGVFSPAGHSVTTGFDGACSLHACDLDADGDMDILGAGRVAGETAWWSNDGGNPIQWTKHVLETGNESQIAVHACDLDQDDDLDVIAANYLDGEIMWWSNSGTSPITWSRSTVTDSFFGAHHVKTADIDGDGLIDVVACSQEGNAVSWWRNEGGDPLAWSDELTIDASFTMASAVAIDDIDGDGDADVLSASLTAAGRITWWSNEGGQPVVWSPQDVTSDFSRAHWVETCDIDGDGDRDVLGAAYSGNEIAWWSNDGGDPVSWTRHTVAAPFLGALSACAADLDGDGDQDVVAAANTWNRITWWENSNAVGSEWQTHTISSSYGMAWASTTADVDGDGDIDVIGTAEAGGRIDWWEVLTFADAGSLTSTILDSDTTAWWGAFEWDVSRPPGSVVSMKFRSGNTPESLGPWTTEMTEAGYVRDEMARYVQYEVHFERGDGLDTPRLRSVTLRSADITPVQPPESPGLFHLLPNYPNPFNPRTTIRFELLRPTTVDLDVYDVSGRLVCSLLTAAEKGDGRHEIIWGGCDSTGRRAASGTYFCRLRAGGDVESKRMTLLK